MAYTFKTFKEIFPIVVDNRYPILLRGKHGIGKSMFVYQIKPWYEAKLGKKNIPIIERRASQMTEGDLLGLPKVDGDVTRWLPPDWLKQACDEPCILFIDEIDRATQEVRQGFFQLCDSRAIAGNHLHPDTLVFSAVNGGEYSHQYQVSEMCPAELDRWTVFDLEPSVEDWLEWGESAGIHKAIRVFISQNPQHLEHNKDFEPNKVYPSRRSWHRFSDCCNKSGIIREGESNPQLVALCNSFLGLEASIAFSDFIRNYSSQVSWKDLMVDGKFDLIKDWQINDYLAYVEKVDAEGYLKDPFLPPSFQPAEEEKKENEPKKRGRPAKSSTTSSSSSTVWKNFIQFLKQVPAEVGVKLFFNLAQSWPKNDPKNSERNAQIVFEISKELGDTYKNWLQPETGVNLTDVLAGEKKE